jgi:hypothetical protein
MKPIRSTGILLGALCALAPFACSAEPAATSPQAGELPGTVTLSSGVKYEVTKAGAGATIRAGDTVVAAQPGVGSADADYAAFQALRQEIRDGLPKDMGAERYFTWMDSRFQALKLAALTFYAAYPTDARRWELVMDSVNQPPLFIKAFGPDVETKGWSAIIADETAAAEWRKQGEGLMQAMLASADAAPALREKAEWDLFARDFRAISAAKAKGAPFDYNPFRARFNAHVAKYADLDAVADRAANYLGALERNLPGASTEVWKHLLSAPNAALRAKAAARMEFLDRISKPLEMSFTAVDGRVVI